MILASLWIVLLIVAGLWVYGKIGQKSVCGCGG